MADFNGLGLSLGNLARISRAQTRSISPENFGGEKGRGGTATEGTGAEAARDRAEQRLRDIHARDIDFERARIALMRALIRLQVAAHRGA